MDVDLTTNCEAKSRIQVTVDLKTDAQGNLSINLTGTKLRTGSDIAKAIDLQYAEFKPLGMRIRIVLDQQLSTGNDYSWSSLRAYHYQVGNVTPSRPECLPNKQLIGTTTVVHLFSGYSRRWYGSLGTIEGGVLIVAKDLPKAVSIGVAEVDWTIVHR
jgi:hypothetical protein